MNLNESDSIPKLKRGDGIGIHQYEKRDKQGKLRIPARRKGSGKRKHLGDHITDVGTPPNELANRERALRESK